MTKRNIQKNILVAIISSALFAGAVVAIPVIANAQNGSSDKVILSEIPSNDSQDVRSDGVNFESDEKSEKTMGRKGAKGRHLLGAVMDNLGLEKTDIRAGIEEGLTLGEVAEVNGIPAEDVISTITSIMTEKLNEAVAEGKITGDEALEKAADIQERAEQMTNKPLDQKPERGDGHKGKKGRHLLGAVMDNLGLEKTDIRAGIEEGLTLGEVAEVNGIPAEDVISTITSIMTEKLNEAVAEGKITGDEALEKAADIQERAEQMTNKPLDQKPERGDGHKGKGERVLPETTS